MSGMEAVSLFAVAVIAGTVVRLWLMARWG